MAEASATAQWMRWAELPWLRSPETGGTLSACTHILEEARGADEESVFLGHALAEVAAQFSTPWTALLRRDESGWQAVGESGQIGLEGHPVAHLEQACDRESAGLVPLDQPAGWKLGVVPLGRPGLVEAFVLAGRHLEPNLLPAMLVVGRLLGHALDVVETRLSRELRIDRLQTTLSISRRMGSVQETSALLDMIAHEALRLLDCDRGSIFIHDPARKEIIGNPAVGIEGVLRLPDDVGLVGEVIHAGERIVVDDAYADERFNQEVDAKTGYRTRTILCEPMRDAEGRLLGVFQVINKAHGTFDEEDQYSLQMLAEQAAIAIQNTREREELLRSRDTLAEQFTKGVRIIGESEAVTALRATIERVADTELPVLVLGESGTGKEVVSQSLHCRGPRSERPFIAVNCAALAESLLESELFGHEAGSFTDARSTRQGKFELADGGTLFLDEIGDMSPGGQAKLLRVLEEKVITRVGGSAPIPVDVRVIAATNANLVDAVQTKAFRRDLYYRLSVVTLEIPPLRERPEDVLPLAEHFLQTFCAQAKRPLLKLSNDARRRLQSHHWPGNVRELRNLMERVAFLAAGDAVKADDLAFILAPESDTGLEPSANLGLTEATKEFQRDFIRRAIDRMSGNMSSAAGLLGLHRSNLYRKMRQLDMETSGEED